MTGNANAGPSTPTALSRARLTRSVALALVAVWSGALTLSASPVSAATPSTPYDTVTVEAPDGQATGRWGERIVIANDINGDGANDYFVATPSHTVGDLNNSGRVYLMSGRTHALLYRIDSPEPQAGANFGFYISVFGDANGDGRLDIAIGTDAQDVGGNAGQGKAWAFSGRDGSLLYAMNNPDPQPDARFGSRIGAAGDVTADGIGDVIVGASNNDIPSGCGVGSTAVTIAEGCYRNIGQAYIFNGANGDLVRELNVPDADRTALGTKCFTGCGGFGIAVQGPGDTNGNGVVDQLVGASNYGGVGRMYVFEGATGALRLRIDPPQPEPGQNFGFQDAAPLSPGDVNGDGRADLYANGFLASGPAGAGQGRGWIFSGTNGSLIRTLDDPTPVGGGQFGWSLAATDFNKDGVPDQYIGQAPHHIPGGDQSGGTYVFDGRDGSVFKIFEVPAPATDNPRLGWGLAAAGDLNGDGEPDYLGGAPFADVGDNSDQGRVYAFLSRVAAAPPPPGPGPGPGPGPPPDAGGKFTAKMSLARATINRRDRVLDVLAPITARASGRVRVELHAAGRKFRFTAPIDSAEGRIRFRQPIPAAQARLGTGIITIRYLGDSDTRPQTVRLRAAFRPAVLRLQRPQIVNGRVRASGTVSKLARGVVRLQLEYEHAGGSTAVLRFRAPIRNGRWSLNEPLSETASRGIAQRRGTLHSYTLFTGYFQQRMRGEMRSFQVLPDR